MPLNEAMCRAVPVVTTDAVGAAAGGLVVDGRTGVVVPEEDPDALAMALRRLLESPRPPASSARQAGLESCRRRTPRWRMATSRRSITLTGEAPPPLTCAVGTDRVKLPKRMG